MNIKELNKWSAEVCGVDIHSEIKFKGQRYAWDLEDARCREIFRNWWLNDESNRKVSFTKDNCFYEQPDSTDGRGFESVAIEPTEIACIVAIMEAEVDIFGNEMSKKLLPCPFCGSDAEVDIFGSESPSGEPYSLVALCTNIKCFMSGHATQLHDEADEAVKQWNTRAKKVAEN